MLSKAFATLLGSGAPVRLLSSVQRAASTASTFTDPFDGVLLSTAWTKLSGTVPTVSGGMVTAGAACEYVHDAITGFDDTVSYIFETDIVPHGTGDYHSINWQMNGSDGALVTGYAAIIQPRSDYATSKFVTLTVKKNGASVGSATFTDSVTTQGTLHVAVVPGASVTVSWRGSVVLTIASHTTTAGVNRIGFNMISGGVMAEYRAYYTGNSATRSILVAGSNGSWYYEDSLGGLTAVSSSLSTTLPVMCAEHLGYIFAPNYGTPKYFKSADASNHTWSSTDPSSVTKGTLPTNVSLICQWRGRIVLAGDSDVGSEQVWYMSRQDNPWDWDFGASVDDTGRAVAGTSANQDVMGAPITALIPFSLDYLILATLDSMRYFAGDPAAGGSLLTLSESIGCIGGQAWCITPSNEVVFMARSGLYVTSPGVAPVPLSNKPLPRELQNISAATYQVQMAFDTWDRGIYLFLTPIAGGTTTHWFIDWETKTFWPQTYQATHQPTALYAYTALAASGSRVLIGGSDGYIRRPSDSAGTDDGSAVSSYAFHGPLRLGTPMEDGSMDQLQAVLGENSADVAWEVRAADTGENSLTSTARCSGTWSGGRNHLARPRIRGQSAVIKVSSSGIWSIEEMVMFRRVRGRTRV